MSRTFYGTKKVVKIDKHSRSKYSESDIRWEKFKIFLWILLGVLYIYFIIQPQIHF
jgi:Na+/H+ antiporter NhaD/arsenite permease-like protein